MNLLIPELLRVEVCGDVMTSARALQTFRLELPHAISQLLLPSNHGSNDNDRSFNHVQPSHLPVWT